MSSGREFIAADDAESPFFAGVDVGGTNIKIGIVDNLGRSVSYVSIPTESDAGPEDGAKRIADALRKAVADADLNYRDLVYVGLGTPGTQDIKSGMILSPHNLPAWANSPIRDLVSDACGKPVAFANDANAAAYGEFWVGSGQAYPSLALITLGTGVGGGIILGDVLVEGENSAGGEIGHVVIDYHETARPCPCGHRGHLEAYTSATSVVKRTQEQLAEGRETSLTALLEQGHQLTTLLIAQEAEAEDELALEIVDDTARYLAIGVVNIMHIIDPAVVILGGAMNFGGDASPLGRRFLARVQQEVALRALEPLAIRTTIDFATLGGDAGYIGAAGLARLAYLKEEEG